MLGEEGFGRRELRSFGGLEVGEDLEERRNLGSHDLVSFESSILLKRSIYCSTVNRSCVLPRH